MPYLSLSIFPLVAILTMNWMAFSWGFRHGGDPVPAEFARDAEKFGRRSGWLRILLLPLFTLGLAAHESLGIQNIGLRLDHWKRDSFIGLVAGLLAVGVQGLVVRVFDVPPRYETTEFLLKVSTSYYALANILGVFSEELWIALCLV